MSETPKLASAAVPATASTAAPGAPPRRAHSPCMGICRMDVDGHLCIGCLRTLDEVASWSTATEETRFAILKNVAERRAAIDAEP